MASSEQAVSGVREASNQITPEDGSQRDRTSPGSLELIVATRAVPARPILGRRVNGGGPGLQNVGASLNLNGDPFNYLFRGDMPQFYILRQSFGTNEMHAPTVCTSTIVLAPNVTPIVTYSMFGDYGGGLVSIPTYLAMMENFEYVYPVLPTRIMGTVELGVIGDFVNHLLLMGHEINIATSIVATLPTLSHGHRILPLAICSPLLMMSGAPAVMWNAQAGVTWPIVVPELASHELIEAAISLANNKPVVLVAGDACQDRYAQAPEAANIDCGPPEQVQPTECHYQHAWQLSVIQAEENVNPEVMESHSTKCGSQIGCEIPQDENSVDIVRIIDVALSLLRLQTSANEPQDNASCSLVDDNINLLQPNLESLNPVNKQYEGINEDTAGRYGAIGEPIPGRSVLEPGGPGYRHGLNQKSLQGRAILKMLARINSVLEDCERCLQDKRSNTDQIMAELSGIFEASGIALNFVNKGAAPTTSPPFPMDHDDPEFVGEWARPSYFVLNPPHPERPGSLSTYRGHILPKVRLDHFM